MFRKGVRSSWSCHFLRPRFSRIESPIDAGSEAWKYEVEENLEGVYCVYVGL